MKKKQTNECTNYWIRRKRIERKTLVNWSQLVDVVTFPASKLDKSLTKSKEFTSKFFFQTVESWARKKKWIKHEIY